RLERGTYELPSSVSAELRSDELMLILHGISLKSVRRRKRDLLTKNNYQSSNITGFINGRCCYFCTRDRNNGRREFITRRTYRNHERPHLATFKIPQPSTRVGPTQAIRLRLPSRTFRSSHAARAACFRPGGPSHTTTCPCSTED